MELDNPQHSKQFQNLLLPWSTRNICDGQWQGVVALKTSRDCRKQSNQKGCKWHTQRVSTKHAIALLYRRSWHVGMFVNLKYVFISNLIISHHYVQTWQTLTLVPLNGLFTFFWIHLFDQNWSRKFLPIASWTLCRHSRRRHSGDRRRATGLFCFLAALLTGMATQPAHAGVEPGVFVVTTHNLSHF